MYVSSHAIVPFTMFEETTSAVLLQLNSLEGQHNYSIAGGILALLLVVLYGLLSTRKQKLPLPYYYVEKDVIATLEKAHSDVRLRMGSSN